jgi:catechol 2,3-dioxygenase-like lactoylglutathione lyase family enzyme
MILKHVARVCSSEENADRFYRNLLGLKKKKPKNLPSTLSSAIFNINSELKLINYMGEDVHFEIFLACQESKYTRALEHVCLEVDGLEEFLEKCRALEVKIIQVPKEQKLLTFILDYDDNLFEIKSR